MSIFQLIAGLFAIFMLYTVSIHRRKKHLSNGEAALWFFLWSGFIFIALFPNVLLGVTQALHFARVFDFLTVVAFMVLSIVVFLSYFGQKAFARKIEDFIRRQAIDQVVPEVEERSNKKRPSRLIA